MGIALEVVVRFGELVMKIVVEFTLEEFEDYRVRNILKNPQKVTHNP